MLVSRTIRRIDSDFSCAQSSAPLVHARRALITLHLLRSSPTRIGDVGPRTWISSSPVNGVSTSSIDGDGRAQHRGAAAPTAARAPPAEDAEVAQPKDSVM